MRTLRHGAGWLGLGGTLLAASAAAQPEAPPKRAPVVATPGQPGNRAPRLSDGYSPQYITLPHRRDEALVFGIYATDEDGDPITIRIEGLPAGARQRQTQGGTDVQITWPQPVAGTLFLQVVMSDGKLEATEDLIIHVDEEWEGFFLPGVGYSFHAPAVGPALHGVRPEIVLGAWIHRNEERGPSHGRLALDLDVLSGPEDRSVFIPALTFDLSLERNPARSWLLPIFGASLGWYLPTGQKGSGMATPFVGLHLYAAPNFFVTATGGYLLPFSTSSFDTQRGPRASLAVDFALW